MTTEDVNLTGWIIGAIGTAFGAMGGAVAMLFNLNESKNTKAIEALEKRLAEESASLKIEIDKATSRAEISDKKHDECLRDREELRIEIAKLRASVDSMKRNSTLGD